MGGKRITLEQVKNSWKNLRRENAKENHPVDIQKDWTRRINPEDEDSKKSTARLYRVIIQKATICLIHTSKN
jgi:hypothetical protein